MAREGLCTCVLAQHRRSHMENLRGPAKRPFHFNPRLAKKMARLHRLKAKGLTPATDKASMREACDQAASEHPEKIRR
jgi:hypothetical protein